MELHIQATASQRRQTNGVDNRRNKWTSQILRGTVRMCTHISPRRSQRLADNNPAHGDSGVAFPFVNPPQRLKFSFHAHPDHVFVSAMLRRGTRCAGSRAFLSVLKRFVSQLDATSGAEGLAHEMWS